MRQGRRGQPCRPSQPRQDTNLYRVSFTLRGASPDSGVTGALADWVRRRAPATNMFPCLLGNNKAETCWNSLINTCCAAAKSCFGRSPLPINPARASWSVQPGGPSLTTTIAKPDTTTTLIWQRRWERLRGKDIIGDRSERCINVLCSAKSLEAECPKPSFTNLESRQFAQAAFCWAVVCSSHLWAVGVERVALQPATLAHNNQRPP